MNIRKIASLSLAVALQVLPITRAFVAVSPATGSSFAIVSTWIAGALALMGGLDAVSGASSLLISPATATTGVPYSGIVQYSGAHASSVKSWELKNNWSGAKSGCNTVYEIAPGLWLTNVSTYLARVGGTPTAGGTFSFTLKIWSGTGCTGGDSDTRSATIAIAGGTATAPSITTQPVSQTVTAGANVSFTVAASGTAPLSYQWKLNGANVAGGTSATLNLTGVTAGQAGNYTCTVGNTAGSVTSSGATLTVNPAPVAPSITAQPISQTVTAGANVSFTVAASGTAPLSYQWRLNGGNLSGATSATLSLTAVTVGQAGSYSCVVTNVAGSATTSAAILTVNPATLAPSITTQPVSQTVTVGANVNFTVAASGTAPLSYQWRLDGANLSGATSATLSLTGVTAGQAGSYSCLVTNVAGSATSSAATLTVNPAPVAPSITTQPVSQTVTAGANVSFTVAASGTAPLSYQWRFNGATIGGATSATLNLNGVTAGQAGSYTCVVTNLAGSATSSAATLTVNPAPVAPSITTQPTSQSVISGANVSFAVTASGTAPLSYQWRLNGVNLSGATSAMLNLTGVTAGQAGSYTCVVTNMAGSATSTAATLTVNATPVAPALTTQPASQTVNLGGNVSFLVAANGTTPLSYQWQLNGANLGGATSATLSLTGVTLGQAGNYRCVVTNAAGSATSSEAILTVNVPPSITTQPAHQNVAAGANVTFTVAANGTAPLSYQWRLNGANIGGATSATLSLTGATSSQAGSYTCLVSNMAGSATSSAATLTVMLPPTITTQPASQTVTAGANVNFAVVASGTAPLSYQWQLNGVNLGGAMSASLSLTGVTTNQSGNHYSCVVSNGAGSATSTAATLTVNAAPVSPAITTQPASQTVTAGATVTFTVTASGTAPLGYQWRFNGVNIGGATSPTLTLANVTTNRTGTYVCVVNNASGSATSSGANLTVQPVVPQTTTLTLVVQGQGTVTPNLNAASLTLGQTYTMTANAAAGYVFAGWSGNVQAVQSSAASLTFVMVSNLVLQASFVPTPFTATAGTYNGLFFENDEVRLSSAGAFKFSADGSGNYTGWLQLGYARHTFSGKLDSTLRATNVVPRWSSTPLTVELLLGQGDQAGMVSGRVTDGAWNSILSGGRATGNSPYAGKYTLVIPGLGGDAHIPAGDGFATLSVGVDGTATMIGTLADGSQFTQSAMVTDEGDWPVYVSLYSAKGAVVSWMSFASQNSSDVSGTMAWIKQAGATAASYPAGFTNETKAVGSLYVAPAASGKVLNLSGAEVNFSGGELGANFNNVVSLNAGSSVVNLSPNALTLTLSPTLGSFTGQVAEPGTGAVHLFGGVVLQKQNAGYGFVKGVKASGRVVLVAP